MTTLDEFLEGQLKDPDFKKEYDAMEPEFALAQAMIDARINSGITPMQLSERTGIAEEEISRMERGDADPSVSTLQKLAAAIGMQVRIMFQPIASQPRARQKNSRRQNFHCKICRKEL